MLLSVDLKRKSAAFAALVGLSLTICSAIFYSLHFLFFVPSLIILTYQKTLSYCLWCALITGLFLDLLFSNSLLGIHASSYVVATLFLYSQTKNFFSDNLTTLPLMTYFFSFLATLVQASLILFFQKGTNLTLGWVFTDLFIWPLLDGLYAFLLFIFPGLVLFGRPRKGSEYFLS